jgi:hypothetical protein
MLELTANNFTPKFDVNLSTLDPIYRQPMLPMIVYFKQVGCPACENFDKYYMEFDRSKTSLYPRLVLALSYVTQDIHRKAISQGPDFLKATPTIMFFIGGIFVCKIGLGAPSSNFGATVILEIRKFLDNYRNSYPEVFGLTSYVPPPQYPAHEPYDGVVSQTPQLSNQHQLQYRTLSSMPSMAANPSGGGPPPMGSTTQQAFGQGFPPSFHQFNTKKGVNSSHNANLFSNEYDPRLTDYDWDQLGLAPKGKEWSKDFSHLQRKLLYP